LTTRAIELLSDAAVELAGIHRAKHYMEWYSENADNLGHALAETEPFNAYASTWIFTGAGGYHKITPGRFGAWAIHRLVAKTTPQDILIGFAAEVRRNTSSYVELSPVLGVQIDRECQLAENVKLIPKKEVNWWGGLGAPEHMCFLCQSFEVRPAFEVHAFDSVSPRGEGIAKPDSKSRDVVRHRVRLACLLASAGAVELPISHFQADEDSLFIRESEAEVIRPMSTHPRVSFPADEALVKTAFAHLADFEHRDSLARAIDRLGRARLASSPVDKALELGIAAEIALMHGETSSNTEIAHKIGGRAAWLLGRDSAERTNIFAEIKLLYQARSQAVHSGVLSAKSKVNLETGDKLVARTLIAILLRGHFPNWPSLVMGGGG
jgi:hypothetical protein